MSIFNQLTFSTLFIEIVFYVFLMFPISNFIRKKLLKFINFLLKNQQFQWLMRILLFICFAVFFDTFKKLLKISHEQQEFNKNKNNSQIHFDLLQFKVNLFYSHRNLYLSLFSLFMVLVLYQRIKDISFIMKLQEELEGLKCIRENTQENIQENTQKNNQKTKLQSESESKKSK